MSKVITLTRARAAAFSAAPWAEYREEAVRFTLVYSCALALIAAGRAFPF